MLTILTWHSLSMLTYNPQASHNLIMLTPDQYNLEDITEFQWWKVAAEASILDQKEMQLLSGILTTADSTSNLDVGNYITVSCAIIKLTVWTNLYHHMIYKY